MRLTVEATPAELIAKADRLVRAAEALAAPFEDAGRPGRRQFAGDDEGAARWSRLAGEAIRRVGNVETALFVTPTGVERRQVVQAERDRHLASLFGPDELAVDDEDEQAIRDAWGRIESDAVRGGSRAGVWAGWLGAALADVLHVSKQRAAAGSGEWYFDVAAGACPRCIRAHQTPGGKPRVMRGRPRLTHPGCSCAVKMVALDGPVEGRRYDTTEAASRAETEEIDLERARRVGGEARVQGLRVRIESPIGSTRSWAGGSTLMSCAYGFIEGTRGADGEEYDCYVGPDPQSPLVYIIEQAAPDGSWDESKAMLGFSSLEEARATYLAHRNDGERAIYGIVQVPMSEFAAKVLDHESGGMLDGMLKAGVAKAAAINSELPMMSGSGGGQDLALPPNDWTPSPTLNEMVLILPLTDEMERIRLERMGLKRESIEPNPDDGWLDGARFERPLVPARATMPDDNSPLVEEMEQRQAELVRRLAAKEANRTGVLSPTWVPRSGT